MKQLQGGVTRVVTLGDHEPLNIQELLNIRSDQTGLIIQIFAHGGLNGISYTPDGELIPWQLLAELVSNCRSNHPVRLELLGACNSKHIMSHLTSQITIDQIWVTTEFTTWQSVYNHSRNFFTFVEFLDYLSEDPEGTTFVPTYREVKWGNLFRPALQ